MRFTIMAAAVAGLMATAASAQDFDLFAIADSDHDGKVTATEYAAFREGGWNYLFSGQDSVKVADADPMSKNALAGTPADAQGNVTHQAYTAASPALFKKADKNGDGILSAEELQASMAPPAG